jgi:hypothetical protein
MRTGKKPGIKPRKKTGRKILKGILLLFIILILMIIFLVPVALSSDKSRKLILAKINESIAGHTNFTSLSMGWFKGVKVEDFSFNDDSGEISVRAGQIEATPHYTSILSGNFSLGQTVIDKPKVEINLQHQKQTTTEVSTPKPKPLPKETAGIALVSDIVVNNGSLRITDQNARTVEANHINSKISLRPPGQQSRFNLNMNVGSDDKLSTIQADGQITPGKSKTGWSLKGTSGDVTVEVNDLDLESLAPFLALGGVDIQTEGLVSGDAKGQIKDGQLGDLAGNIKAKNLDISGPVLKGDRLKTSELDINVNLSQKDETIDIENLRVKSDWATASASGTIPTTFGSFTDFMEADSGYNLEGDFKCNVAAVLSQMPHTLGLKEGMQVTSGELTGNVQTTTSDGRRQIHAQATLAQLQGTMEGKDIALSDSIRAEAKISSDKTGITYDKLDISAPFAGINCSGKSDSLQYNAQADLAKLQSELGQFVDMNEYEVAGEFESKGQMSITEDKFTTSGSSVFKNLRLKSQGGPSATEPMAEIDTTVEIDMKNSVVLIPSLTADASFGQISVKNGVVPLNSLSGKSMDLDITANQVDLEKVRPFAILFGGFPEEMQLAGMADSMVSVTSEKDLYKIATDSTKIKNLKLTYPDKKPFEPNEVTLAFNAEINPSEKAINIKTLQLNSPEIKIHKGEFSQVSKGEKTRMAGQAECEYDWTAVDTIVAPYLPEGLTLQGKRKDSFSFSSEFPVGHADQFMPNLNADGTLGFEQADYMGLDFGPTETNMQIDNGVLTIAPFTTTVNEGQLNFSGQTDFNQKPPLLKTTKPMQIAKGIKVNDETARKLLKYVSPIFANAINTSGITNFFCEQLAIPLSAEAKNKAVVIGTISIDQLRIQASDLFGQILTTGDQSAKMVIRPTRFSLQNGFLHYDDLQLDVGDNPVNFSGTTGLDGSLDMTVTLPYTLVGRTVRIGKTSPSSRITLPLTGTLDHPQIDTSKLIENQWKELLQDLFEKGLEDIFK